MAHQFVPKPGQIDYTHRKVVPVVNCLVIHDGRLLLVKRSEEVSHYPGYWHCIAGYLDDGKNPVEKAREEIKEETGLGDDDIVDIRLAGMKRAEDIPHGKIWIVHYCVANVRTDAIRLDWEATEHRWTPFAQLASVVKLIPGFKESALGVLRVREV